MKHRSLLVGRPQKNGSRNEGEEVIREEWEPTLESNILHAFLNKPPPELSLEAALPLGFSWPALTLRPSAQRKFRGRG